MKSANTIKPNITYLILLIFIFVISYSCGGYNPDGVTGEGSIAFKIQLQDTQDITNKPQTTDNQLPRMVAIDCNATSIFTVDATVSDSSGTTLSSGSWSCSAHTGTINNVSAGSNRRVIINGKDSGGIIKYSGEQTGITVTANSTTDAGTITIAFVSGVPSAPTSVSASAGNGQATISWNPVVAATSYNIYRSTTSGVNKSNGNRITNKTSPYTDTGRTNGITYYYVVTAVNSYGESSESSQVSALPTTGTTTTSGTYEPNDSFDTAYSLTSGSTITTRISSSTDVDYYAINVTSAGTISISMTPPSSKDYDLELFNPSRSSIDISGGGTGVTESISYTATTTGTYYIKVYGFAGAYDATNTYTLTVTWTTSGGITDTTAPSSPSVSINSGASSTTSTSVTLTLSASDNVGVTGYYASETSTTPSASASGWTAVTSTTSYSGSVPFTLSSGNGTKTVYVWFKDSAGNISASANDSITLSVISWTLLKLPDTGQTTSYTTTFGEDHDYTINPPSYTDNGNGTITDNVTGLMWQKEDDNTTRTWTDAGTYCDNLTLGSQTDWRLPSDMELISIVNYGTFRPSINGTYFPNTNDSDYWSSTTYEGYSSDAWSMEFDFGGFNYHSKSYHYYVRCVRGGQ